MIGPISPMLAMVNFGTNQLIYFVIKLNISTPAIEGRIFSQSDIFNIFMSLIRGLFFSAFSFILFIDLAYAELVVVVVVVVVNDGNIPNVGKYVFSKHSESILLVAVLS